VFLGATFKIKRHMLQSFRTFQLWDLPGQIDYFNTDFDFYSIFSNTGVVVWVLDAQDDYLESVSRCTDTILQLVQVYPDLKYAVFIHKVDSISNDFQDETVSDVIQRITDELNDAGLENPPVYFYPTSVYDHSIYEAVSKVLQSLLATQLDTFEALLGTIASTCKMQKLYLFDVETKIYFASDTSPVDLDGYGLCADFIDAIVDLSEIYGWDRSERQQQLLQNGEQEAEGEIGEGAGGAVVQAPQRVDDGQAESFISGVRDCYLYLKEMNRWLALIGFSKEPRFAEEKPLIDYNMKVFQDALTQVLSLT